MTSSFQIFHLESTYVQKDTNTTTSSSSTTTATTTTTTHSLSLQPTSELRESTTSTSPSFTSTSPLFKPDSTPSSLTHSTSPTLIKQNELPSTVPFTIQPSSSLHPTNTLSSSTSPLLPTLSYAQLTQHFQSSLSSSLRKLINDNEPFPASSTSPSSSTLVPLIHSLAQLRQRIHHALQRNFDVVTAIDVIGSGNYCGMPKIMATYLGLEDTSEKPSTSKTIMALNHAILLRLVALECGVPKPLLNNFKIIHGTIQFTVQHEFSVTLTLPGGPDPDGPWHLLDFRILDPTITLQPYQLMNLMRLGQAKLSKGIKEVQVVEEKEKNKHNASTRRTHPVVTFPLLELYHFYHQFVLTLRFENLVLQAHVFRHHESMHILHEGRRLEVLYWTGSVNQGRLRIQLKETIHTHRINVSWHPHVRRPPDPMEEMILPVSTSTSSFTSMLNPTSPPVTVDYTYPVTTLVVDSMDPPLTPVTVTTQTFMELYQHCLQRHTQTLFQHMQGLVPQGVVEKQTYFHVPSHRVRVSVHKKTGGFYVTSSDMYHDQGKIANIEKAINQGLDHLPRSLAHLATSVALDHLETAALFLGFQPSVLPRPLHHVSNDSLGGTLALHSKVQEKELDENRFGPAMFLRVLHLPQHPDYHLAINSLAPQQLTCWVIRSPSNTVVRQYTPKLSSLVQSFKQCIYLHQFKEALSSFQVQCVWEHMCLKIYPDQWPIGSGILSILKDMVVTTTERFQFHLTLHLRVRFEAPFDREQLELSHSSASMLAAWFMDTLLLLRALAFMKNTFPLVNVHVQVEHVQALFQVTPDLQLQLRVHQQVMTPTFLPTLGSSSSSTTLSPTSNFLFVLTDALNAPPPIPLHRIFKAIHFWIQVMGSFSSFFSPPPTLILKTMYRGSIYFTPHIALHLRFLFHEQVIVLSHHRYLEFTRLCELLQRALQHAPNEKMKGCIIPSSIFLIPLSSMSIFLQVLQLHIKETAWLIETYGYLLTYPTQVHQLTYAAPHQVTFEWTPLSMLFTITATHIVAQCHHQPTLATLCTVPVPVPEALKSTLISMFTFLNLPDQVRHLIVQCQRPPELQLVWITPANVPASFGLPPYLQPCCLVSSNHLTVSLVFQWSPPQRTQTISPTTTNTSLFPLSSSSSSFSPIAPSSSPPLLIPLQYAWKVNVVSPWESDLPSHMLLNPSMILERLVNAPDANRVATWLNSFKSEPYLGENRLAWTLQKLMAKTLQEAM